MCLLLHKLLQGTLHEGMTDASYVVNAKNCRPIIDMIRNGALPGVHESRKSKFALLPRRGVDRRNWCPVFLTL